jgi:hypothetical protein
MRMKPLAVMSPTARFSPMYVPRYPQYRMRVIHDDPFDAECDSMWCVAMSPQCA